MAQAPSAAENALPDLSATPQIRDGLPTNDTIGQEEDLVENLVEGLLDGKDIDIDGMIAKSEAYQKKLEKGEGKSKTTEKEIHVPTVKETPNSEPVSAPDQTKPNEPESIPTADPPKGKKNGTKAKIGAKARMALLSASQSSAPAIKPAPSAASSPSAKKEVGKGKGKEGTQKETLVAIPEKGATWDTEETTPRIGDENFPRVIVPTPSSEYAVLSNISSQYEDVSNDVTDIANQLREVRTALAEMNLRFASLEKEVTKTQTDKAQFHSLTMDRIRAVERQLGNRPPLATPAKEIAPVAEEGDADTHPTSAPLTKEEILARLRQAKK